MSTREISAVDVARAISSRTGPLGPVQLQKLLYYVQAWSLAVNGRKAYPDVNKAWTMGPVVPTVWHTFRNEERPLDPIPRQEAADVAIDAELDGIIDLVVAEYGSRTGTELSAISHEETPWAQARDGVADSARSAQPIDTDTMKDFYREHRSLMGMPAWQIQAVGSWSFSSHASLPDPDLDPDPGTDPADDPLMRSANLMAVARR